MTTIVNKAQKSLLIACSLAFLSACTEPSQPQFAEQRALETTSLLRHSNVTQSPLVTHDSVFVKTVNEHSPVSISPALVQSSRSVPASSTEENYAQTIDSQTYRVIERPVSTFSIDVDTGSYANVRRFLNQGQLPPENAVRVEELINYFDYDYPIPDSAMTPFSVTTLLGRTPWNDSTHLMHVGLKGYIPQVQEVPPANLVFLIDVSGSMQQPGKLDLLKTAMGLLVKELDKKDRVSIVVYAGSSGTVLETTPGNQHSKIIHSLEKLQAGGSTNGVEGIELAYDLAKSAYIPEGVNRVILATDGDFNVGMTSIDELKYLIKHQRQSGIELTTLGFGTGNYNDELMEQLANTGNGNYAYIDTIAEAKKALVDERLANLFTIAKDVKIQVEFNPNVVNEYRLVGYGNRILSEEDFNNDRVDAGEIGAGHTVTAIYELALKGENGEKTTPRRYAPPSNPYPDKKPVDQASQYLNEIGEIKLRYKLPNQQASKMISYIVENENKTLVEDHPQANTFQFSASVALFGQILGGDNHVLANQINLAIDLAEQSRGADQNGYRSEYLQLLRLSKSLMQLKNVSSTTVY